MKLKLGPIPEDHQFPPGESGWSALREPGFHVVQVSALLVALGFAGALVLSVHLVRPEYVPGISWPAVILLILLIVPIHEVVHALLLPGFGFSEQVTIGFWPKRFLLYAHYEGALSKARFLLVAAGPLLVLSVAPLVTVLACNVGIPLLIEMTLANGLLSAGDLLVVAWVWWQVPGPAEIKNNGPRTYWRKADAQAGPTRR